MAGGGNQLLQPYIKKYIRKINLKNFKEVQHIHDFSYYIVNYQIIYIQKQEYLWILRAYLMFK